MTRAIFRHVRWVFRFLHEEDGFPRSYSVKCSVCGKQPEEEELPEASAAEKWAFTHAASADGQGRHHMSFRMIVLTPATVTPHPDEALHITEALVLASDQ